MASRIILPSLSGQPRLPDADQRLQALIVDRMRRPFQWGTNDCALWAADAIQAQLGTDPAAALRGTYSTYRQCQHVLAAAGGLVGVATAVLGQPLAAPLLARVGDVGLLRQGALAVCAGATWLAMTTQGLGHLPIDGAQGAWMVGHA